MSIDQIKNSLTSLSVAEREEVSAFLYHLRHTSDPENRRLVDARMADKNPDNWLSLQEFERRLDQA